MTLMDPSKTTGIIELVFFGNNMLKWYTDRYISMVCLSSVDTALIDPGLLSNYFDEPIEYR